MSNLHPTLADFERLGTIVEEMREQLDDLEDKTEALEVRCTSMEAKNAQLERHLIDGVTSSLAAFREEVRGEVGNRALQVHWDLFDAPVELANGVTADTTMDVSPFAAPGNWVRVLVFARAVNNATGRVAKVETVSGEGVVVSRGFVKIHGGPQTDVTINRRVGARRRRGVLNRSKPRTVSVPTVCEVQDTFDLYIPSDGPASVRLSLAFGSGQNVSFTCLCTAVGVERR